MVKKDSKKKVPTKKKKVKETFEVKGKTIKKTGIEEIPIKTKDQEKQENKILRNILIITGIIILLVVGAYFYIDSLRSYNYEGVEFTTIQEGELILYKTFLPVPYQGEIVPYNIFFRTKPTKLKNIEFNTEDFTLMKNVALNIKTEFDCKGYQSIAIGNIGVVHNVARINLMHDQNATCDPQGRYMLINIEEGDKSEIISEGNNCYTLKVNNCEILPVTERFLLEVLSELNKL